MFFFSFTVGLTILELFIDVWISKKLGFLQVDKHIYSVIELSWYWINTSTYSFVCKTQMWQKLTIENVFAGVYSFKKTR